MHIIRELDAEESFSGRCRHLGEGGLGAVLAGELPVGDTVTLDFTLPGAQEPLRMRAVVRYRHGFHHGFEFLTLKPSQLDLIRRAEKTLPPAE
ncbi:MAG TPA: PilZ domain-containing protein [Terriglobales bacterium]|nr:PilZ domain-containing protein [Terriglobales bacterium]